MKCDFWKDEPLAAALPSADRICARTFVFDGPDELERTHIPVHFENEIIWDRTPNGDPEWVYALNRLTFLPVLGRAYAATGKECYARQAADLLKEWEQNAPLCEQSKTTTWRPLEAGIRCETLLRTAWLFRECPLFDVSAVERILRVHAAWLMESDGSFQTLSNWGMIQNHGLLLAGLALGEELWRDTAVQRMTRCLQMQVLSDGSHWEQSPLYHYEVLHCALDSVLAARETGAELPEEFLEITARMSAALKAWCRPDGRLVCQSDSDAVDATGMMSLAAALFEDERLAPGAGVSTALTDSGNYMLRDSAQDTAGWLHFHCGSLGSGHGHADLLHVDLVANGESILVDSGRYTYTETAERRRLKLPSAHNVLTVDGEDFTAYVNTWEYSRIAEPMKGSFRFSPSVDYVSGAHLGYLDRGVVHRRRVLRLGRGLWLLADELHARRGEPHRYTRYFHFGPDGNAELAGEAMSYRGKRASAVMCFAEMDLAMHTEIQPVSLEYNSLLPSTCLIAEAARCSACGLFTIIASSGMEKMPELTVRRIPVRLAKSGRVLGEEEAAGLRIVRNEEEWIVIISHTEIISQVDLLEADGKRGYGKVLVFLPDTSKPFVAEW